VSASGQSHHDLSITKRGNRRLRTALVEMAWRLVRYQPELLADEKVGADPQFQGRRPSAEPQTGDCGLRTAALCGPVEMEDRTDHGRTF